MVSIVFYFMLNEFSDTFVIYTVCDKCFYTIKGIENSKLFYIFYYCYHYYMFRDLLLTVPRKLWP